MDIKRAKNEIKNSIQAYLAKDEFGEYRIPTVRQRPILLMGAPGIGKTAVMEQVARNAALHWFLIASPTTPDSPPLVCPSSAIKIMAAGNTP